MNGRERETYRQTQRQRQKQRDRDRDRQRQTHRQRDRDTERDRDRQTKRERQKQRERQRQRQRERCNHEPHFPTINRALTISFDSPSTVARSKNRDSIQIKSLSSTPDVTRLSHFRKNYMHTPSDNHYPSEYPP